MAIQKYTEYSRPDWTYWSQFSTLKIWEVAALMAGVDPRRLSDMTDENGDGLDLSDNERMLRGSVLTGDLESPTATSNVLTTTEVSVRSLLPWLRRKHQDEIADGLAQQAATPAVVNAQPQALQRARAQEHAILQQIQKLGHDPRALPKAPSGKPGVKSLVKSALGTSGLWTGPTVFNKAWERLRGDGRIADKP
jgi:hypothetical protein